MAEEINLEDKDGRFNDTLDRLQRAAVFQMRFSMNL
jgi:hypothetical protein